MKPPYIVEIVGIKKVVYFTLKEETTLQSGRSYYRIITGSYSLSRILRVVDMRLLQ